MGELKSRREVGSLSYAGCSCPSEVTSLCFLSRLWGYREILFLQVDIGEKLEEGFTEVPSPHRDGEQSQGLKWWLLSKAFPFKGLGLTQRQWSWINASVFRIETTDIFEFQVSISVDVQPWSAANSCWCYFPPALPSAPHSAALISFKWNFRVSG